MFRRYNVATGIWCWWRLGQLSNNYTWQNSKNVQSCSKLLRAEIYWFFKRAEGSLAGGVYLLFKNDTQLETRRRCRCSRFALFSISVTLEYLPCSFNNVSLDDYFGLEFPLLWDVCGKNANEEKKNHLQKSLPNNYLPKLNLLLSLKIHVKYF